MVEIQRNHYGQHIHKSDEGHLKEFDKGLYGLAIVYPLALTFSKLSLLALYWRIFRVTSARRPLQIVAALNVGWMIAAVSHTYYTTLVLRTANFTRFSLASLAAYLSMVSGTRQSKAVASRIPSFSRPTRRLQSFWIS